MYEPFSKQIIDSQVIISQIFFLPTSQVPLRRRGEHVSGDQERDQRRRRRLRGPRHQRARHWQHGDQAGGEGRAQDQAEDREPDVFGQYLCDGEMDVVEFASFSWLLDFTGRFALDIVFEV